MAEALVLETSFILPTTAITSYTIRFPKCQITDNCLGRRWEGGGGGPGIGLRDICPTTAINGFHCIYGFLHCVLCVFHKWISLYF